jgi:hypothetical protein
LHNFQVHYDRIHVKEGKSVEHQFDVPPGTTLGQLKDLIATKIQLDAAYFDLISKGKKLTGDDASLAQLGLRYGSKLALTKTAEFYEDKPTLVHLHGLSVG